jgi:hypothetical protein
MIADIGEDQSSIWFSKKAIANILSLKDAIALYQVTYDSDDKQFIVHQSEHGKPNMLFKMHSSGLHYYDPFNKDFNFINTVNENKAVFTKRQIASADKARELYAGLAYPLNADYKWILKSNQIKDCPVSIKDAKVATNIWGPNIAALKRKTTQSTPNHVITDIVKIPVEIRELHKFITISINIFFVNKIIFFITLIQNCFTTVTNLSNCKVDTIFKAFEGIFKYYYQRGFQMMVVTADSEFKPLEKLMVDLPGAPRLNLTSANEHEPYVEHKIRAIKERVCAVRHSLPFSNIPAQITTHMVFFVTKLLNFFPVKGGISDQYSPKAIMSGEIINYRQYCLPFGSYCQVHKEDLPRNSMEPRTQGAISLGPSTNRQGSQKFYTLTTSKVIVQRSWNVIPTNGGEMTRVNLLGADQPLLLTFYNRLNQEIGDVDMTKPIEDSPAEEMPGVIGTDLPIQDNSNMVEDNIEITGVDDPVDSYDYKEPKVDHDIDLPTSPTLPENLKESINGTVPTFEPTIEQNPNFEPTIKKLKESPRRSKESPRRSSRTQTKVKSYIPSKKGKSYEYAATQVNESTFQFDLRVVETIFTQLSLKAVIKTWGKDATNAA